MVRRGLFLLFLVSFQWAGAAPLCRQALGSGASPMEQIRFLLSSSEVHVANFQQSLKAEINRLHMELGYESVTPKQFQFRQRANELLEVAEAYQVSLLELSKISVNQDKSSGVSNFLLARKSRISKMELEVSRLKLEVSRKTKEYFDKKAEFRSYAERMKGSLKKLESLRALLASSIAAHSDSEIFLESEILNLEQIIRANETMLTTTENDIVQTELQIKRSSHILSGDRTALVAVTPVKKELIEPHLNPKFFENYIETKILDLFQLKPTEKLKDQTRVIASKILKLQEIFELRMTDYDEIFLHLNPHLLNIESAHAYIVSHVAIMARTPRRVWPIVNAAFDAFGKYSYRHTSHYAGPRGLPTYPRDLRSELVDWIVRLSKTNLELLQDVPSMTSHIDAELWHNLNKLYNELEFRPQLASGMLELVWQALEKIHPKENWSSLLSKDRIASTLGLSIGFAHLDKTISLEQWESTERVMFKHWQGEASVLVIGKVCNRLSKPRWKSLWKEEITVFENRLDDLVKSVQVDYLKFDISWNPL